MNVFNGYMDEYERSIALENMRTELEFSNLMAMLEMVDIHLRQQQLACEYKVFSEGGTYDDYMYLLEEEQQQANQQKEGIFQQIFNAIGAAIQAIINGIASIFNGNKINDNAQYNISQDDLNEHNAFQNVKGNITTFANTVSQGKFSQALSFAKSKLPWILAGGTVVAAFGLGTGLASGAVQGAVASAGNAVKNTVANLKMAGSQFKSDLQEGQGIMQSLKKALESLKNNKPQDENSEEGKAHKELLKPVQNAISHVQKFFSDIGNRIGFNPFKKKDDKNPEQVQPEQAPTVQTSPQNNNPVQNGQNPTQTTTFLNPQTGAYESASVNELQSSIFGVDFDSELITEADEAEFDSLVKEFDEIFA